MTVYIITLYNALKLYVKNYEVIFEIWKGPLKKMLFRPVRSQADTGYLFLPTYF